jgi:Uma2 family endonuclease
MSALRVQDIAEETTGSQYITSENGPKANDGYLITLNVESVRLTDKQFVRLSADNPVLRFELTAQRELIIMAPAGLESSRRNNEISFQLTAWSKHDGSGVVFESSAGFTLPNGAKRSPDASWISHARYDTLSAAQKDGMAPICPEFVVELRSASDRLKTLQRKMQEYIDNGARLGWLLDPTTKRVYVYRPGQTVEVLEDPDTVSGEPVLSGFVLDLRTVW